MVLWSVQRGRPAGCMPSLTRRGPHTAPVKIVYIINHLAWFWSHRLPLAQGVRSLGWDVIVAAPGAADDAALHSQGIRGTNIASCGRHSLLTTFIRNIYQVRCLLERERPTIVHAITLKA